MIATVFLVAFWQFLSPFLSPATRDARRGHDRYQKGEFAPAAESFEKARRADPDPRLDFNLGAAHYRQGDFAAASRDFQAARRGRDLAPGAAEYNDGNARFRAQDLAGALEQYRAALRSNPGLEEARWNYEWTQRMLADSSQQEDQQPPPEGNENQPDSSQGAPDDQEQAASDSTKGSPGEDGQGEEQGNDTAEAQPSPEGQGEETPQGAEGRRLSKEEAAQLLDAMIQEERELIASRLKASRRKKAEKDW